MIKPRIYPPRPPGPTADETVYLRRVKRHLIAYMCWIEGHQAPADEGRSARDLAAVYALSELVTDIDDRLAAMRR